MAPYFEVERGIVEGMQVRKLGSRCRIIGKVGGKDTQVDIINDDLVERSVVVSSGNLRVESSTLSEEKGATVFDTVGGFKGIGGIRVGIVHLPLDEARKLANLKRDTEFGDLAPGVFLDSLDSLWRRMEVQVGKRERGKWTLGRRFLNLLSAGRTEDFTRDY